MTLRDMWDLSRFVDSVGSVSWIRCLLFFIPFRLFKCAIAGRHALQVNRIRYHRLSFAI
jgi:hypothetical protein